MKNDLKEKFNIPFLVISYVLLAICITTCVLFVVGIDYGLNNPSFITEHFGGTYQLGQTDIESYLLFAMFGVNFVSTGLISILCLISTLLIGNIVKYYDKKRKRKD